MTLSIGRMRTPLDESVQFSRLLDGSSNVLDVSPARCGRRARLTRASILVGAIVCAIAAPATARAADPFGTQQIVQEVDSAVAEATATAIPQTSVAAAAAPADPTKNLDSATKTLQTATEQAAAAASSTAAEAERAVQSASVASAPASSATTSRAPAKMHARAAPRRARRPARSPKAGRTERPTPLTSSQSNVVRIQPAKPATLALDHAGRGNARGSRATSKPTAGPTPQRPPPSPLPPRPGTTLSSQGGGQGPPAPLVFGALGALLLLIALEFLPRVLPTKAFRKPRQLALAPWHPG
jgi:hypothetical protein